MENVGFGIIGSGLWSELHARIFSSTPDIELSGTADIFEQKAESLAHAYGTMRYKDYRALLADQLIKAVSIVTPDFNRAEVVLAAVKAGKHVLVEPPLAKTEEECREILDAARASGSKIMVDFHNRWIPPLKDSKESIARGEIGGLQYIDFHSVNRVDIPVYRLLFSEETTVGWFAGIHSVDTLRWLTGSEVRKVYTVARSRVLKSVEIDTPDFYQTIIEFESGATAAIEDSWIFPQGAQNIMEIGCRIAGSRGVLFADTDYTPDIFAQPDGFAAKSVRHFIDCVLHDREPQTTGMDGLIATRVVQAMERSACTGSPVEIG